MIAEDRSATQALHSCCQIASSAQYTSSMPQTNPSLHTTSILLCPHGAPHRKPWRHRKARDRDRHLRAPPTHVVFAVPARPPSERVQRTLVTSAPAQRDSCWPVQKEVRTNQMRCRFRARATHAARNTRRHVTTSSGVLPFPVGEPSVGISRPLHSRRDSVRRKTLYSAIFAR